ncbi:MAG: hypothetical protein IH886_03240 [Nitrospinae bacterium]|nr:hypothetical protein [Nitrospinota bacterium]
METINPDFEWYESLSQKKSLHPRCPFASVNKCPRYYESLSLLRETGATELDPEEDERLLNHWKTSDFWPRLSEQASSVWGREGNKHISNFCPEVSFLRFNLFASHLYRYSDEIDLGVAHSRLGEMDAPKKNWRWAWEKVVPMHYSECPLYSPLAHQSSFEGGSEDHGENSAIIQGKPTFWGMKFNYLALWARIEKWKWVKKLREKIKLFL